MINAYYNPQNILDLKNKPLTIDTNIISLLFSDKLFFQQFCSIFKNNDLLIDPIIKLEFLRGVFIESIFKQKNIFLQFEKFCPLPDHQEIYVKVNEYAFKIARIYSHNKQYDVPLGDIFIMARLAVNNHLFITHDEKHFDNLLFDRITVITIERNYYSNKFSRNVDVLEHFQIVAFNHHKLNSCLERFPK